MKFQTVTDLTSANVKLNKVAETIVGAADQFHKDLATLKEAINKRYSGTEYSHIDKSQRRQVAEAELRKEAKKLRAEFEEKTDPLLKEVGQHAQLINDAAEFYTNPVKRLNVHTSRDPDMLAKRNEFMTLLKDAGPNDLETQFQVAASTNDLPVLAAISSIVNARDDASLRKLLPNAKVAAAANFGDNSQLDAIFHAGKHMTSVVLENTRGVTAAAMGKTPNGIDAIKKGLREGEAA